jgi:hypothetical protein
MEAKRCTAYDIIIIIKLQTKITSRTQGAEETMAGTLKKTFLIRELMGWPSPLYGG